MGDIVNKRTEVRLEMIIFVYCVYLLCQGGRIWAQVGQIGPKWEKSGTIFRLDFSTCWQSNRKKSRICPIYGQSEPLWFQM